MEWGMKIVPEPVSVPARIVPKEEVVFGGQAEVKADHKNEWSYAFRSKCHASFQ